jgi:type VI secretion system secreted protein VgrG
VEKNVADAWGRVNIKDIKPGDYYDVKLPNGSVFKVPTLEQFDNKDNVKNDQELAYKGLRTDGLGDKGRLDQARRGAQAGAQDGETQ